MVNASDSLKVASKSASFEFLRGCFVFSETLTHQCQGLAVSNAFESLKEFARSVSFKFFEDAAFFLLDTLTHQLQGFAVMNAFEATRV